MGLFNKKEKEPEPTELVFCKDCRHCENCANVSLARCQRDIQIETIIDLVTGKEVTQVKSGTGCFCSTERGSELKESCGKKGKFFDNKHKYK